MQTRLNNSSIQTPSWMDPYFSKLKRDHLSPVTIKGYWYNIRGFLAWYEQQHQVSLKMGALVDQDIDEYRKHLIEKLKLKPASANRRLDVLRGLCKWGHSEGLLKTEMSVSLVYRTRDRSVVRLMPTQVQALLRAAGMSSPAASRRNYALIQLLLDTGLRLAEVAKLQIGDVIIRERQGWVDVRVDQGIAPRRIPLSAPARRALNEYLTPRGVMKQQDPLFCSKRGRSISLRALHLLVATVGHRARHSVPEFSSQMFRDTFSINYLKANPGKYVELAKLLGYCSVASTNAYRDYLRKNEEPPCRSPLKFSEP